ncbi:MAG: glycine betaine/L-proline ABC transporter ATP-binding protein [Phycisphaeraceae bacterium]
MALLRTEGVTKIFGPQPERALPLLERGLGREEILERTGQTIGIADVSFEVERGEIVVIMGLSGSGKSTLVRCVNRLIEPTSGRILLDDEDILQFGRSRLLDMRRHRVAMIFQRFALFPTRTVLENAAFGLEIMGRPESERKQKAADALELVGLKGWEDQYPGQLSGGMQQRVGVARALAVDPEIILMDEAFSALDPLIRKDMQNELIDLQRKLGTTILFITHDLDEAINLGDRIVLMKDGYVVQQGTAEEILTNPANDYVRRFVEDVDMSAIMTVGSIMRKPHDLGHTNDGPRVLLRKMRSAGMSSIFVVDAHGKLQGITRAKVASEMAGKTQADRANLVEPHVKTATPEQSINEIVPLMAENHDPVAVVDDAGVLRGVIVAGTLLAALAEGTQTA